jgi:hypothetical protein
MQIVKLPFHASRFHGGYDDAELQDYDLEKLKSAGVETLIYFYGTEPYAGSGKMLYRIGTQWGTDDLGHCSCYGPLGDGGWAPNLFDSLEAATLGRGAGEWMNEMQPLYDEAIKLGF